MKEPDINFKQVDEKIARVYPLTWLSVCFILVTSEAIRLTHFSQVKYPRADPMICGCGILISALLLTLSMLTCRSNLVVAFVFLFLGEVGGKDDFWIRDG